MADNVTSNPGVGGATFATDDVGGIHYPISKLAFGVLDSVTLVSGSNGLPVAVVGSVPVTGTFWQATQPVSAASLPLPSGASTEATLSALNAKVTACNTGAVVISSLPAVSITGGVAATNAASSQVDGHSVTLGATTDAAAGTDTANVGLVALFKRLLQRVTTLLGQLPAALTGAGNLKVSLQESNATQAVSGTVSVGNTVTVDTELPAAATLADATPNPSTVAFGGLMSLYNGTTWDRVRGDTANGIDVDVTRVGGNVTVVDGGGSLTVDSPQLPAALVGGRLDVIVGAALPAGTNNIGDVDVLTLPAIPAGTNTIGKVGRAPASSATLSNVAASASSVTLLASNANRVGATIVNDGAAVLYVKFGATASATSYSYRVEPYGTLEFPEPVYPGVVDGLWTSATGSARCTEMT